MIRPAAPESETPLIERLRKAQWDETAHRGEFNKAIQAGAPIPILEMVEGVARLCGEAATALSLAQTEIKGHMRVVDELRRDLANEIAIVNRVWKALGIETYDAAKPFAIDEHVTLLKGRIAELEGHIKILTRPAWNSEGHMLPTLAQVEAARAALKSRA